jgi:S1-C subfamily serine protease
MTRLTRRMIPAILAVSVAGALLGSACSNDSDNATPGTAAPAVPLANLDRLDPARDPLVQVIEKVRPAVVNVTSDIFQTSAYGQSGQGTGTGFIIRSDGIVVTNYHVVEGANKLTVITTPPNSKSYDARVIGGDASADLAVLKIEGRDLPTIPLGSSADLKLGQRVVALGYALALKGGPSVTTGIVSAMDRTITAQDPNYHPETGEDGTRTYSDIIQTDAAINPGNSGGPLVNLFGEVIGINSAGAGQAENIGFSISIDAAKPIIERAVANPDEPVAYLGVVTQTVNNSLAYQFDLPVDSGAYVVDVATDGPAEDAGVGSGDVIVEFDGQKVTDSVQLGNLIRSGRPGETVEVVVETSGGRETYDITLGTNPLP